MSLIRILLLAISLCAILAGISIFCGCTKKNKANGFRFFLATVGSSIWTIAIMVFLGLPTTATDIAPYVVVAIIAGVAVADMALLGYFGWPYKSGKIATIIFCVIGVALVGILYFFPEVFYSEIVLDHEINKIVVTKGWYYAVLIAYFFLISITFSSFLNKRIKSTSDKGMKTGLKAFYIGQTISGILGLVFDLILLTSMPKLIWIGPMATAIAILTFYFSTIKFRVIPMSSRWMKILSYIVLIVFGLIIYMLAFYAVFTALFRIPNPSFPVILLNVIMTAVLLLLMPAIREVRMFLRSMITVNQIDFGYITNKISRINSEDLNIKELAGFLAENLHYSYIAIIVDGKVYGSIGSKISASEASGLKNIPSGKNSIWQVMDRANVKIANNLEISRIAMLINKNGQKFGQVVFGKKLSKLELSRKDIIEYETIINLTAMVIENGSSRA